MVQDSDALHGCSVKIEKQRFFAFGMYVRFE